MASPRAVDLRAYILAKQEVTRLVRRAMRQLESDGAADRAEQGQELLVKLAEDRFNLAVVGQFKRGKSSLMNAIIGRDLLPTGVLPLTSAITALRYGPRERVLLRRRGWTFEQEIALPELADFVTERGNPGNERGLVEARVELPVPFLRRGLFFIDTPGVGSSREENTATSLAFLPHADAVVFVTSVDGPLGETEERFLREIRDHVRRLLVVVNKIDAVGPGERDEVLAFVRARLAHILGTDDVRVHAVSATQALAARLQRDHADLEQSGLVAFEDALATFLTNEQGRTFLVAILDRALALLVPDEAPGPGRTSGPPDGHSVLGEEITAIRARLLAGGPLMVARGPEAATTGDVRLEAAIAVSQSPATGRRVQAEPTSCPICTAQGDALFTFFATWQHTLATDEVARREFSAAGGFCLAHTWQFQQLASPQAISVGYVALIEAAAASLRGRVEREPAVAPGSTPMPRATSDTCAACEVLRRTEAAGVTRLLDTIGTVEGRDRYTETDGPCLPHLELVLASARDDDVRAWLIEQQIQVLEELSEDLHSYTLKREAVRRGLLNVHEAHAWRRALVQLVGERVRAGAPLLSDDRV